MKFKKYGQSVLALVVSLGLCLSLTSCTVDYTIAYLFVTGSEYNQIGAFKIANNKGTLTAIQGSPFGSGGTNPIRDLISTTGRFLYVLNAGTEDTSDYTYSSSNIAVFSVGGDGTIATQQTYTSQGNGPIRFSLSSSGAFMYVLDQYAPITDSAGTTLPSYSTTYDATNYPCPDPTTAGIYHPVGDITAFSVNANTGRLSLITNSQATNADGTQLSYFPVGCNPVDFKVGASYIYTVNENAVTGSNVYTTYIYAVNSSSGQLTVSSSSPQTISTNTSSNLTSINSDAASKYIYILDAGLDQIDTYTVGTNGVLQAVSNSPFSNSQSAAGDPVQLTSDSKSKFLYVANDGPSSTLGNASSDISAYTIATNGVLASVSGAPFGTGSSPRCIIEDPSDQYIYTADYTSSTVTGHVLDPNSGVLTDLVSKTSYATVGNPTWCVADSHTD
ncbi:beta-propeller fold lactonase family protein [Silvibacterium sp.]|uniref:beta-propeller fold lactonase family protein n=1 Tax=Silvibacterium sp. TaxID=1964179 RepID=UPI0039E3243B